MNKDELASAIRKFLADNMELLKETESCLSWHGNNLRMSEALEDIAGDLDDLPEEETSGQ